MNDYYEVTFDITPSGETASDLLAAFLADEGFESFVPQIDGSLTAYIASDLYKDVNIDGVIANFPMDVAIKYHSELIRGKDWNEEWEKNYFQPIVIGGKVVIHSSFHKDVPEAEIDISIDPKMAFGTGHHATTSQVATALLGIDLNGLTVTDMGTGTGILAMLACKLGASKVTAIEIDGFAYTNALENAAMNECSPERLDIIHGDASALERVPKADVFLANINRNIILADMEAYQKAMKQQSSMILSGFYVEDIPMIEERAKVFGFETEGYSEENNWACLMLKRS